MSRVILISGDLASGKSSLADSLSLRLNIPAFKKDEIKEIYVDKYGFSNREENRALSVKAVEFMIDALKRFISTNQDVILEANFRQEELDEIHSIIQENNCDVDFIVLRGDLEVLYQRFLDRLPNRHIAHQSMHLEESLEKFSAYVLEQRTTNPPFIPFIIDTTNLSNDEVFIKILNYLKK